MVISHTTPGQALENYRKSDAVFIVCQNNEKKVIEIAAVNDEASRITGYTNEDLVGKPLDGILPERISSTISEYIEYEEDQNDLLTVLGKIRNFSIRSRDGNELEFKLRIIRGDTVDRNPWFHLVLVNQEKLREANAFRDVLKENFKGHEVIDERTGLPTRVSLIKDLELTIYYVREHKISASFAVIDINHYERLLADYGPETCNNLHRHIGHMCKLKLRNEDTIGTLSERSIGIVLIDAQQEPARMVLNRLRWAIGVTPLQVNDKEDLLAQVNISFAQIDGKISQYDVLEKSEDFMKELRRKSNNSVQLVITHERREKSEDRRKQNVPVAVDRRKTRHDRRKPEK